MSDEIVVLRVFDNEIEARMAQTLLQGAGVATFVFKDDGGGMEPHLQRTIGVRLVLNNEMLRRLKPFSRQRKENKKEAGTPVAGTLALP